MSPQHSHKIPGAELLVRRLRDGSCNCMLYLGPRPRRRWRGAPIVPMVVLGAHHERNLFCGEMIELTIYPPLIKSLRGPVLRLRTPRLRGHRAFLNLYLHPAMVSLFVGVEEA